MKMYDRRRRLGDDTLGRVRANNRREDGGIRKLSDAPGIAFRILFVQISLEATAPHAERKPSTRSHSGSLHLRLRRDPLFKEKPTREREDTFSGFHEQAAVAVDSHAHAAFVRFRGA